VWPWSTLYELTFMEHLGFFVYFTGLSGHLQQVAQAGNPQEEIYKWLVDDFLQEDDLPEGIEAHDLLCLLMSILKTLESKAVYGKNLSEQVEAFKGGNDTAFIQAVRIDPSITHCETFSSKMARAVIEKDRRFLKRVGGAIRTPRWSPMIGYNLVRLLLSALHEASDLDNLKYQEMYHFFSEELNLVAKQSPSKKAGDAFKNFQQFVYRWKKKQRH
jgi:hypothetical protein